MKKETSILVKAGYLLGIIFCLVASISLVYASYMMVSWTFSEHPDIVYSDYSNSYDYYEYETSGQDSDTISDTIDGETIIFQELGFENYAGLVDVSYNLNVPSDTDPDGLEIYFIKSVNGYHQFANSYDSIVTDYKSCQKKNVMTTSGSCTIRNGGGIMIYNTANKPRSFTLSFTIKYNPSLIESN